MQEFSSISVSSYEAGMLADRLTEQSRDGWAVVAIVPTGSSITAYLQREAADVPAEPVSEPVVESTPEPVVAAAPVNEVPVIETPIVESQPEPVSSWSALAESAAAAEAAPITVPEISIPEPSVPEPAPQIAEPVIEPVSEPAGWAIAPESTTTAEPAAASDPMAGAGAAYGASSYDSGAAASVAETPADTYVTAAVETQPAAAASAAPAGWYADPSSRYELRYWDGTQWTEHVSRAGQQFTDPPVA